MGEKQISAVSTTASSIEKNSLYNHEIIVHVNEVKDNTRSYLSSLGIKFSYTESNVGLCTAINNAVKLAKFANVSSPRKFLPLK